MKCEICLLCFRRNNFRFYVRCFSNYFFPAAIYLGSTNFTVLCTAWSGSGRARARERPFVFFFLTFVIYFERRDESNDGRSVDSFGWWRSARKISIETQNIKKFYLLAASASHSSIESSIAANNNNKKGSNFGHIGGFGTEQ